MGIAYSLSPSPPYCLFTIPYYLLPPLLPIAYSLFPILYSPCPSYCLAPFPFYPLPPLLPIPYSLLPIPYSPLPPLLPILFPLLPPSTLIAYSLLAIHLLLLSFMEALFKRGIQKHIYIYTHIYIYIYSLAQCIYNIYILFGSIYTQLYT